MSFATSPAVELVTAKQVQKLLDKFSERQAREQRERFWQSVQDRKQPQPIDWECLPVG